MVLSLDLRQRIVDLVASGVSRREAARHFKVGTSSAIRFVRQARELGHVKHKARSSRRSRLDVYRVDILGWITEQPDITLSELSNRLQAQHNIKAPTSTIDDGLKANQITYKKNGTRYRTRAC